MQVAAGRAVDRAPPHSRHATNTGRQLGTQEAGVGRLVCDAPDGGQSEIDRGRCVSTLLEMNPVAEHDGAVEREARLRTVPDDELANGMVVRPLAAGGCETVQDRRLGVFEVRKGEDALGRPLSFLRR